MQEAPITSADDLMKVWMGQLRRCVSPDDIVAAISARLKTATGEDRYELASQLDPFLVMARRRDVRPSIEIKTDQAGYCRRFSLECKPACR
jgi:hypothetical protein